MNEVLNYNFLNFQPPAPQQLQSPGGRSIGQAVQYQPLKLQQAPPSSQPASGNLFPPIQRGWSGGLAVPGAAGQRRRTNNGVSNALNYESDSATNVTAPVVTGGGGYALGPDEQSTNDNSYARAVIPLDSKGQISLSRDGPVREFNSLSLRPMRSASAY